MDWIEIQLQYFKWAAKTSWYFFPKCRYAVVLKVNFKRSSCNCSVKVLRADGTSMYAFDELVGYFQDGIYRIKGADVIFDKRSIFSFDNYFFYCESSWRHWLNKVAEHALLIGGNLQFCVGIVRIILIFWIKSLMAQYTSSAQDEEGLEERW